VKIMSRAVLASTSDPLDSLRFPMVKCGRLWEEETRLWPLGLRSCLLSRGDSRVRALLAAHVEHGNVDRR